MPNHPSPSGPGAPLSATPRQRDEELLRQTVSMLCNVIWRGGRTRPDEHVWSLPANPERDFDFILTDAIDELVALRAALAAAEAEQQRLREERDKWRERYERPFVRFELAGASLPDEAHKPPRYHVYGIRENGVRVGLQYMYLRDEVAALAALGLRVQEMRKRIETYADEVIGANEPEAVNRLLRDLLAALARLDTGQER